MRTANRPPSVGRPLHHQPPGRQRGASAVEFTLVAIPLLLVGLGTVELSRWFFVKQAISLALLEAARAGSTDHARPTAIEAAFERALLPLFPPTSAQSAIQRRQESFMRRQHATGAPPWRIRVALPDAAAFQDFASPRARVPGAEGLAAIDNDYQAEQHESRLRQGWPGGRGPASGATIFDANSLALDLTYMHEPLVPGMRALMGWLSRGSEGYARAALAGGYLPMRQSLRLTMQSHPVAWPHAGAKVITGPGGSFAPLPESIPCHGIWCGPAAAPRPPGGDISGQAPFEPLPTPAGPPPGSDAAGAAPPAVPAPSSPEAGTIPSDDLACGVVLCCLAG